MWRLAMPNTLKQFCRQLKFSLCSSTKWNLKQQIVHSRLLFLYGHYERILIYQAMYACNDLSLPIMNSMQHRRHYNTQQWSGQFESCTCKTTNSVNCLVNFYYQQHQIQQDLPSAVAALRNGHRANQSITHSISCGLLKTKSKAPWIRYSDNSFHDFGVSH